MLGRGLELDEPTRERTLTPLPLSQITAPRPAVSTEETVFSLLADRARGHSIGHLVLAAAVGVIDAVALVWSHPAAWALAALCAAAGAYGLWGLADRALTVRVEGGRQDSLLTSLIRVIREVTALVGFGAAIAAGAGLFGAALGTWIS